MSSLAIVIATGPSVTEKDLNLASESGLTLFGMNHIWRYLDLNYFLACNPNYYHSQWDKGLKDAKAIKYTWDEGVSKRYNVKHIKGAWGKGFSKDPNILHYGHSSGFQLPGLAYNLGFRRLLLLGYDMSFSKNYNGANRQSGSTPRHFFGEYPSDLQHWPTSIKNGRFDALIKQFEEVKEINPDVEIINCCKTSAMKCFPFGRLEDYL